MNNLASFRKTLIYFLESTNSLLEGLARNHDYPSEDMSDGFFNSSQEIIREVKSLDDAIDEIFIVERKKVHGDDQITKNEESTAA